MSLLRYCDSCRSRHKKTRAEFILEGITNRAYFLCYDHARLIMVRKDGDIKAEQGNIETTLGFAGTLRKLY